MKTSARATWLSFALLSLVACQSTGTDKASSTVDELKELRTELAKGEGAIGNTVTTLNELAKEGGDMNAEYKAYGKAVDSVQAQSKRVSECRATLAERREAFVASWNERLATIQNADMKKTAEERKEAVVAHFKELEAVGNQTRDDLDAWTRDAVDVRTYLEHDLNPGGVASLKDSIASIDKRSGKLKETVADFVAKLDKLIGSLEAAKPVPPEEKK